MTQPLCRWFGECGGCRHQDVAYAAQVRLKQRMLRELFSGSWPAPVVIVPSPSVYHYRNKMEFTFGRRQYAEPPPNGFVRESVLGFKRLGKWYWTLDIDQCLIAPEGVSALVNAVRAWMHAQGLRAWHDRSADGVLRHLVVRQARRTGERLVLLLLRPGCLDGASFVRAVCAAERADGILVGTYAGKADAAYADELRVLHGADHIVEELRIPDDTGLRVLRCRISPLSFFQTNTLATEKMYGTLRSRIRAVAPRRLYDLYGGSGGIGLTCADLVGEVVSVEEVATASADGRLNAALNGIGNVVFVTADVRRYLLELRHAGGFPSGTAVVIDPPRAGLHPKVIRRLLELKPDHLLYVSCNPKLLARELPAFLTHYELAELTAFDLFPHTPHVEVLAVLRGRGAGAI